MSDRSSPQFYVRVTKEGATKGVRVGVDSSVRIIQLAFEDTEKVSKLAIEVDNWDLSEFDSPTFAQGDLIEFSYGYGDDMSPPREGVVTKALARLHGGGPSKAGPNVSQGHGKSEGGVKLKIEALGKDYLMNKVLKTRTFTNAKRSDVARQIAQENGYGAAEIDVEDTQVTLPVVTQARMSDLGLLRDMARREGFEVYLDSTGFHFCRRKLKDAPAKTLIYYTDGTGTIMSFAVEVDSTAKPGAVTAVGVDLLKGKPIKERADDASTKDRPMLASILEVVDQKNGATALMERRASETTVATTATTAADAKRQAAGAYQQIQMGAVKLKLQCVGDPQIKAKSIVRVQGIGARFEGLYYVATVTHKITAGYTMDLDCRRNGNNAGTGAGKPPTGSGQQNDGKGGGGGGGAQQKEVVNQQTGETHVEWR